MSKSLTRDCSSCGYLIIDDNYNYICRWGKNKKIKILNDDRVIKKCLLIKTKEEKYAIYKKRRKESI